MLATQRPVGVIKDNLRANTNLRLALRMADEADSQDVLGSPEAAYIDPALPGRAVSKTGPGRLVPFQAAYVGGWTTSGQREPDVSIEELVIGAGRTWQVPDTAAARAPVGHGRSDIVRIAGNIRRAAALAQLAPPRRPWLDELATVYDLARLPTNRRDDELVFGVVDEPEYQRQTTAAFYPDRDGNLAIYGTGGSGKNAALRSFAIAASFTVRGGPCQVYGLDFSSRGLEVLAELPHVGAVISGDEHDRVRRLLRTPTATTDDRARRYAAVSIHQQMSGLSQQLQSIVTTMPNLVNQLEGAWRGPDAQMFASQWPALAQQAVGKMVDLACDMHSYDYFHSGDPVEAAKFVVLEAVVALRESVSRTCGARSPGPTWRRWTWRDVWTRSVRAPCTGQEN